MVALAGMGALAFDMSRLRTAKGELQAAADSAALNAANGLGDSTYFAKAQAVASQNKCDGVAITLLAANVTPGNWSGSSFVANGTPRNAVKVVASRTTAGSNPIQSYMANLIGKPAADVQARSTVALVKQTAYEWTGINSTSITAGNNQFKVTSYDATNATAPAMTTALRSGGAVTINGPAQINADVRYGTSATIAPTATVNGSIAQISTAQTFPPGTQVANISGTPVFQSTYDQYVASSMTLGGGTYVVRNFTIANCAITFSGPTTIIFDGNASFTNCAITTYGNLPANLKLISSGTNTSITCTNLTKAMTADFYAPGSTFTLNAASGYYGLNGRGVFKTMTVNGTGANASLNYDRSLSTASLSQKAVVVE